MQPEQFAAHARVEDRHWWFTARREILLRLLAAVVEPGAPVADIGCGTGGNAAAVAAAGHPVLGLDTSSEAIAHARVRFPAADFRVSHDPREAAPHLANGGAVLLTDVLEHVADDRALLSAAIGALPPGGHLILTVPADPSLWSAHDTAFGHHRRYDRKGLAALLGEQPVTVRLLSPCNSRLQPLIALRRRWGRATTSPGGDLDMPVGPFNHLLHRIFASEAEPLVAALDRGAAPFRRGVSLVAVVRRR